MDKFLSKLLEICAWCQNRWCALLKDKKIACVIVSVLFFPIVISAISVLLVVFILGYFTGESGTPIVDAVEYKARIRARRRAKADRIRRHQILRYIEDEHIVDWKRKNPSVVYNV